MSAVHEVVAGLDCLTVKNDGSSTAVIMLHGYGANMYDLFPLWELWDQKSFSWYFPNGLFSLPMGAYEGRAWFSIDIEKLERAMRDGSDRELSTSIPPEFDLAINKLSDFIQVLKTKYKKIILGGFSQGAMCASHLGLKDELGIDGLILLSANLIAEERCSQSKREPPFYQAHGSRDPILSLKGAKELESKLLKLNFKGKLSIFDGVHEIPPSVINEVRVFLNQFVD
jgi:phospholipase/carboxylesterase